jgi:hypothetical protein
VPSQYCRRVRNASEINDVAALRPRRVPNHVNLAIAAPRADDLSTDAATSDAASGITAASTSEPKRSLWPAATFHPLRRDSATS